MAENPPLRKFMFDRSFDGMPGTNTAQERPRGPVTLKPEQVDALKKDAYDAGFASGKIAGVEEHEQYLRVTMSQIDARMSDLLANLMGLQKEQEAALRQSVLAIARKLLPSFTEKYGVDEISGMLSTIIAEMVHEPRLVVRVNDAEFDAVNAKINEITIQKAYPGKVVVLADGEVARGDCRVEWADGGIERDTQATWNAVEQAVDPTDTKDHT